LFLKELKIPRHKRIVGIANMTEKIITITRSRVDEKFTEDQSKQNIPKFSNTKPVATNCPNNFD
jgi:hypothetical protein